MNLETNNETCVRKRLLRPLHYLHWSGISVFENTVGSSKLICKDCVRYKKFHEDVSDWTDSLVFTPVFECRDGGL